MDKEFWNAVASAASTYVERQDLTVPCSLRIGYKLRCIDVLAFVGRNSAAAFPQVVAELESQGFRVLGHGMSETGLSWGAVVELPGGEDSRAQTRALSATSEISYLKFFDLALL